MDTRLEDVGLTPFFANQLTLDEAEHNHLARVVEVQRTLLRVFDESGERAIHLPARGEPGECPTVGDWVLLDGDRARVQRVLERKSSFRRVAAGRKTAVQVIAANLDIVFVVTSCNEEFRESRLERYLALASEANVLPVVVLTKTDLSESTDAFVARAHRVQPGVAIVAVNSLDASTFGELMAWIEPGSTVALVGSSGVGKTTLLNSLMGFDVSRTAGIREDDKKGRHTTTYRALYRLPGGGLVIDVPGMRELGVADVDAALATVFQDVESLAARCRYADCRHDTEPGCAVRRALENGSLDGRRFANYRKLQRENERHNASLAEIRTRERNFARQVRQITDLKRASKKER